MDLANHPSILHQSGCGCCNRLQVPVRTLQVPAVSYTRYTTHEPRGQMVRPPVLGFWPVGCPQEPTDLRHALASRLWWPASDGVLRAILALVLRLCSRRDSRLIFFPLNNIVPESHWSWRHRPINSSSLLCLTFILTHLAFSCRSRHLGALFARFPPARTNEVQHPAGAA